MASRRQSPPSKASVKAAADRAERRGRKGADAAAAPQPDAAAPPTTPPLSTVRMIAASALTTLIRQVMKYQGDVSTAAGNIGDLVRDYATNKNLHRGAFSDIKKLYRMGKKDPGKLWLHLAHFDDMRAKLKLDELAGEQGQLVDAGVGGGDEADGQPAPADDGVSRPRFGSGHPNHRQLLVDAKGSPVDHGQVIKDAVAGGNAVNDIAKAAGAHTAS